MDLTQERIKKVLAIDIDEFTQSASIERKEKKRIGLCIFDIEGTITTSAHGEELDRMYEQLFLYFEQIKFEKKLDELVFSFSSRIPTPELLFNKLKQLKKYNYGKEITFGEQFTDKASYLPDGEILSHYPSLNKISKINKQIDDLSFEETTMEEADVVWVGFADDRIRPEDIESLVEVRMDEEMELYFFIPNNRIPKRLTNLVSASGKRDLEGLLGAMRDYLCQMSELPDEKSEVIERIRKRKKDNAGFGYRQYPW